MKDLDSDTYCYLWLKCPYLVSVQRLKSLFPYLAVIAQSGWYFPTEDRKIPLVLIPPLQSPCPSRAPSRLHFNTYMMTSERLATATKWELNAKGQPMILSDFNHSWENRLWESPICHGLADVGRFRRFCRFSWVNRCRLRPGYGWSGRVEWPTGHSDIRMYGHPNVWTYSHPDIVLCETQNVQTSEQHNIGSCRHPNVRSSGHMNFRRLHCT